MVDIALETRDYEGVLARLSRSTRSDMPVEAAGEQAYLRARIAYDAGKLDAAEGLLVPISRRSRLYSSALYLRGLIRTRRGQVAGQVQREEEGVLGPLQEAAVRGLAGVGPEDGGEAVEPGAPGLPEPAAVAVVPGGRHGFERLPRRLGPLRLPGPGGSEEVGRAEQGEVGPAFRAQVPGRPAEHRGHVLARRARCPPVDPAPVVRWRFALRAGAAAQAGLGPRSWR